MAAVPYAIRLRYPSRRSLDADHAAYLVHGGMLVPMPADGQAPAPNARVRLDIVGPDGLEFHLEARAGHALPGQGFLVSFEPEAKNQKSALDRALAEPGFARARDLEPDIPPLAPEVSIAQAAAATSLVAAPDDDIDPALSPLLNAPLDERATSTDEAPEPPSPSAQGQLPVRRARPGEAYLVVIVRYPTIASYLPDEVILREQAELSIPLSDSLPEVGAPALAKLTLPGHNVFDVWCAVAAVGPDVLVLRMSRDDETYRRLCLFLGTHQARNRREREARRGGTHEVRSVVFVQEKMPEETEKMPLRRRLQRMGMDDKINLALSGNREERMALALDSNKSIHHYLLKNAKLTLDEVAFMARLPSLNPDVLDKIAENPAYTQNPAVTKALVFNPRTPLRTAIRLLDRLPRSELNVLARRTNMNRRLLIAAKNKLTGGSW